MNGIYWSKKANKQLKKYPVSHREQIHNGVEQLKTFPDCENVKKLKVNQYSYRLRVGNYRVFFDFDGQVKIVKIQEVKKRDSKTY